MQQTSLALCNCCCLLFQAHAHRFVVAVQAYHLAGPRLRMRCAPAHLQGLPRQYVSNTPRRRRALSRFLALVPQQDSSSPKGSSPECHNIKPWPGLLGPLRACASARRAAGERREGDLLSYWTARRVQPASHTGLKSTVERTV